MAQQNIFPSHLINPKLKNKEWILQYVKAAWDEHNASSNSMFYPNRTRYNIIKSYALGKQTVDKYKVMLKADEDKDFSWLSVDWSILPALSKFRRIALGRLMKSEYNMVATPIDSQSRNEQDDYFAKVKAKLVMRQQLQKAAPGLVQKIPALQPEPGEPQDIDEYQMQTSYGFKNQKAIEAEEGIQLIFYQNDIEFYRKQILEDYFDYGTALYKDWIDSNGMVRFRRVDPRNVVMNYCKYADFRDKQYCGELIDMSISELKVEAGNQFTEDEFETMQNQIGRSFSFAIGQKRDNLKVQVVDIDFYSHNELVREQRVNKKGNIVFGGAAYDDAKTDNTQFVKKSAKVYYTAKWIVGTDMIYNYGLGTDMKREKSSMMETTLCFDGLAADFHEMSALGMTEQMMPIQDQIQIAWYRMQNSMNKAVPKGWEIDLDALESVALGKGGKNMLPLDLIDMFHKTGILVTRRKDISDRNVNYKAIQEMPNGMGNDVEQYWQIIQNGIQMLRDITGLNEMSDGSTPNPKTTIPVANMAYESTNNSLFFIQDAEKQLLCKLGKSVILRLQDSVLKGNVSGYIKSLGTNTIKFIQVGKGISEAEFGIMIEDKPTDEARQSLMQHMELYLSQDLLDPSDSIIVMNTWNLKHAQELLAYKVQKRRDQKQQEALALQQQNGNVQIQSAQAAETAKQATLAVEYKLKTDLMNTQKEWDYKIQELIVTHQADIAVSQGTEKLINTALGITSDHAMKDKEMAAAGGGSGADAINYNDQAESQENEQIEPETMTAQ